jgi:hypothetical protein
MARIALLLLGLFFATGARAEAPCAGPQTPEDWAWTQIRADKLADFNAKLGRQLDTHDKTGWDDPCRQISPEFLVKLVTDPKFRDQVPQHGARLRGAHVNGTIDLSQIDAKPELWIDASRIDGDLYLSDSHWHQLLSLRGTTITGNLSAERLRADSDVFIDDHAAVGGNVDLAGAKLGTLAADSVTVGGAANLESADVTGTLFMNNHATFTGKVDLTAAKIGGGLVMETSSFANPVDLNSLTVGKSLDMSDHTTFGGAVNLAGAKVGDNLDMETSSFAGEVNLVGAKVGDVLEMQGASFSKDVDASRLNVGGSLFMSRNATFGGDINLVGAKIGSNLEMQTSSFANPVNLYRLTVGGDLFMNATFAGAVTADSLSVGGNLLMREGARFKDRLSLIGAKVGGRLDLGGATVSTIDLSDADAAELLLDGLGWWCAAGGKPAAGPSGRSKTAKPEVVAVHWPLGADLRLGAHCSAGGGATIPMLMLRNAHFAEFQDTYDAWPPALDLAGFHYDRLGGLGGEGRNDLRQRPPERWIDWLARDPTFSTQPYTELGAVLTAAGDRDTAEFVEFNGRERDRADVCQASGYLARCAWLTFLYYTAGYGIERYMWHVLPWVIGLTLLGSAILAFSANARRHGPLWLIGASLHRLLPVVSLYKEFDDFFDNAPKDLEPRNLKPWQIFYFALHAISGWALGLILLAAISGITQKG